MSFYLTPSPNISIKLKFGVVHCVKSVPIRSFSGPCFSAFGLDTGRYEVSLPTQPKCSKIETRKTPNADTFHAGAKITDEQNRLSKVFFYDKISLPKIP